eukprot:4151194-Pleurochrysis_carterae.AAC.1
MILLAVAHRRRLLCAQSIAAVCTARAVACHRLRCAPRRSPPAALRAVARRWLVRAIDRRLRRALSLNACCRWTLSLRAVARHPLRALLPPGILRPAGALRCPSQSAVRYPAPPAPCAVPVSSAWHCRPTPRASCQLSPASSGVPGCVGDTSTVHHVRSWRHESRRISAARASRLHIIDRMNGRNNIQHKLRQRIHMRKRNLKPCTQKSMSCNTTGYKRELSRKLAACSELLELQPKL